MRYNPKRRDQIYRVQQFIEVYRFAPRHVNQPVGTQFQGPIHANKRNLYPPLLHIAEQHSLC